MKVEKEAGRDLVPFLVWNFSLRFFYISYNLFVLLVLFEFFDTMALLLFRHINIIISKQTIRLLMVRT